MSDFDQHSQGFIHGFRIWKSFRYIRGENNGIRALAIFLRILASFPTYEVILFQHIRVFRFLWLLHMLSFHVLLQVWS